MRVEGSCGNTDTLIRLRSSLVVSGAAEGAVACLFAACTLAMGQVLATGWVKSPHELLNLCVFIWGNYG